MPLTDTEIRALLTDPRHAPPSSKLMGFELLDFSIPHGWIEIACTAPPEFANRMGNVQGGFVTAMLDDAMGVAASVHSGFTKLVPTLQITVSFMKPVPPSRVTVRGEVVRMGKNTVQMAGTLRLSDGSVAATAMASAVIRDMPHLDLRLRE